MSKSKAANMKILHSADAKQDQTLKAIGRIQQQSAETVQLGRATLEEMRTQTRQMKEVNEHVSEVNTKLDTAEKLQGTFGGVLGTSNETACSLADRNHEDFKHLKEIYEDQKYDVITRRWKPVGMTPCSNSTQYITPPFDPTSAADHRWKVDMGCVGIDSEGWTYASDFAHLNRRGYGSATASWVTYTRRRKWRRQEWGAFFSER